MSLPSSLPRVIEKTSCRICAGELRSVLDLGCLHPSQFVVETISDPKPMVLVECTSCHLVQLKHTIDPDTMYRRYWYKSSLNVAMVRSLKDIVRGVESRTALSSSDIVLDIGANDGTLLSLYATEPIKVGFDPAKNLAEEGKKHCSVYVNDYFELAKYPFDALPKVITSIAMFYDLDDPGKFVADIKNTLRPDGLWVIQMTDLVSMLKANAFDNLCMEHLQYYSLSVLSSLLGRHGLEVFDVEFNKVNGGSIRAYIGHQGSHPVDRSVGIAMTEESDYLAMFPDPFTAFKERILSIRESVVSFIKETKAERKTIAALGASTKGNTLLQYFNLNNLLISYVADVNAEKWGLHTVGTNIPIISEVEAMARHPDYFLVLPWHFIDSFIDKNQNYLQTGGKFIVPMPKPAIIDSNGWHYV